MDDFFGNLSTFGFKYAESELGLNPDLEKQKEDAKANEKLQQDYDRLLTASSKAPTVMSMPPISKELLIFGGLGIAALIFLVKGK